MAIFKRPGSEVFYFKFIKDGKQYLRSTGQTEQRKAEAWARINKQTIIDEAAAEAAAEASRSALEIAAKVAEAKRFDFTRALAYFFSISTDRGDKRTTAISSMWNDFATWAESQGLLTLDQVAKGHAAAYLSLLIRPDWIHPQENQQDRLHRLHSPPASSATPSGGAG